MNHKRSLQSLPLKIVFGTTEQNVQMRCGGGKKDQMKLQYEAVKAVGEGSKGRGSKKFEQVNKKMLIHPH